MDSNDALADTVPVHEAPSSRFTQFKLFADAPLAVFRNTEALFLRKRSEDGKHQLAIPAHGVYVLFLEVNVHAQRFQLAHRFQQRNRISGKPADGFGDDPVDFPRAAICQHPLKSLAIILGAGQRLVYIHASIAPFGIALNEVAVIADLRRQGVQHGVLAAGNAGIRRHTLLHRQGWQAGFNLAYGLFHAIHLLG